MQEENVDSDIRYFAKARKNYRGSDEVAFMGAMTDTLSRAKGQAVIEFCMNVTKRILEREEIEKSNWLPYLNLTSALAAAVRKGNLQKARALKAGGEARLTIEIVDQISAIFAL